MQVGAKNDAYIHLYRAPRQLGTFERGKEALEQTGQIIARINRDKRRTNGYKKTITHLIVYLRHKKDSKRCMELIKAHFDESVPKIVFISNCFADPSILIEIQYRIQMHF